MPRACSATGTGSTGRDPARRKARARPRLSDRQHVDRRAASAALRRLRGQGRRADRPPCGHLRRRGLARRAADVRREPAPISRPTSSISRATSTARISRSRWSSSCGPRSGSTARGADRADGRGLRPRPRHPVGDRMTRPDRPIRPRPAVLGDQAPPGHDRRRMGGALRRLRQVLPQQARGRGHRRGGPDPRRLPPLRRQHLPLRACTRRAIPSCPNASC